MESGPFQDYNQVIIVNHERGYIIEYMGKKLNCMLSGMDAVLSGQVSAWFGIRYALFITSALLLINAVGDYFKAYENIIILQN